ncbi:MAG: hypothetical protein AMK69_11050 [Nitrospira bacterium SG8_3]|nr:MAG: hypothetical protein AMK69_11050 [Nitrospira bacterium SG8_3]
MEETNSCDVRISPEEYEKLKTYEWCVLREWEVKETGYRFAHCIFMGDAEECEDVASTPSILVVPNHLTCIGNRAIEVSDLLPPETE